MSLSNENFQIDWRSRKSMIDAVKSPLGFFVLIVLIIEGIQILALNKGLDIQTVILWGLGGVILFGVIVAILSYTRPESLMGIISREQIQTYSSEEKVNNYMKKLISSGSTLDIVSNRLHWVSEDESVKEKLITRARIADINIYLPRENEIARELINNGLKVHIVPSIGTSPNARFTLVDKDRPSGTLLAAAFGRIPALKIQEFLEETHPHVVAIARDYIDLLRTSIENE